ncbi:hypothetical protein D9M70_376850 [compost metagenome]
MRTAIRTLIALTLLAWGQFAVSADYYWYSVLKPRVHFSSARAACESENDEDYKVTLLRVGNEEYGEFTCRAVRYSDGYVEHFSARRGGDSCPSGKTYNSKLGFCEGHKDCRDTAGKEILKTQTCQYNTALKVAVCPDQLAFDGCKYTAGGKKSCVAILDQQTYQCTGSFYGSGESNGEAPDTCTGKDCSQPKPDDPKSNCVTANGVETCFDPKKPGCGTLNGVEGCFQEEPGCGYFNGTYRCMEAEKPNRNCGYFNGKQVCYDPKDPTKQIPESSSDHPKNGGNADGNDTNDPRPSTGTGGSVQGSNEGATNQAIEELGEKLGPKIDKTNSLLGDIKGKLDQLLEGVLGDEYDGTGTGTDGDAEAAGKGAGDALADQIGKQGDKLLGEREAEVDSALKALPNTVTNSWFGADGSKVGLNNVLDRMLPSAMGCTSYTINLRLDKYSANLVLPVCELTRLKPLLEYIIWIITAVGLWKILYAGLRQEDAKAAKGGF